MPARLNQGTRGTWGFVINSCSNQNNVQKPTFTGRQMKVLHNVFVQNGMSGTGIMRGMGMHGMGYGGEGLAETIRGLLKKGKKVAGKVGRISDIASGDTATMLRNMLPSSDDLARPGYPGEKHAILRLPNGKYGVANYMGPGTQLEKRLRRGDPPRTASDRVAQAHDSRYGLAKSQKDVAKADRKMIAKLKELQKRRLDNNFNIQMGMRPIQAKLHAESLGLVKSGKIASFGGVKKKDRALVENQLRALEQEGYGLPGDMLKMKLLRDMKKERRNYRKPRKSVKRKGKGLSIPGGGIGLPGGSAKKVAKHLAKCVSSKMLPMLLKKLGLTGGSLKLAGQGKINSLLNMRLLRAMNDGASRKTTMSSKNAIVGRGKKIEMLKKGAHAVSKTLLPILLKMAVKKLQAGGFSGTFADLQKRHKNPSLMDRLSEKLASGAFAFLKNAIMGKLGKGMCGAGMCGKGFWKDFKKGFMSVMNPVMKVGKIVAPLAPLLL